MTVAAAGSSLWSVGALATVNGLTIARIRGEFVHNITLATSVGDGFESFAVGIRIVSAEAFSVGITAIPSPLVDSDDDGWMWIFMGGHLTSRETTEVNRGPIGAQRIPIDTKAMRKLKEGHLVVGLVEYGTESGTSSVRFSAETRMLALLP